ncbi:Embryonic stem cell-specific 5-hydroxymethylcytosine-binding protein [Acipenser ruthenus]|uniref:Embryonic stem cell-specific 5-hydroxymethylcytosine-binding protein n=1 Tax=Acipenser ruthenus TaxID=7906 RepID=A0A444UT89_ACIRT|nr:Embryonic stem cell-specific 5-hydroxymethylcytosine-binding protein [Acipenser ruthenus]
MLWTDVGYWLVDNVNDPIGCGEVTLQYTEAKPSASSKMMLNWLKTESPKKEGGAPESPERPPKKQREGVAKRGSEGLMQAWLRKAESCEPAKKPRTH